jgi:hypothetical protein
MKLYYYVHTGHRVGLDRFRRAATIVRALGDLDITLLTSDFRIAAQAREFGIKRAVGIDVVRNIPQIAHHGDKIIFDSAELNPLMLDDMTKYFSTFVRISDDPSDSRHPGEYLINPYLEGEGICNALAIDERYFRADGNEKTIEHAFYFGDDDYEEDLYKNLPVFEDLDMDLLLGFYWFLDYEKKLAGVFVNQHENEDYDEVIIRSRILVTASPQAALENLAAGGRPVFLQRPDYGREFLPLLETLNIPVVDGYNKDELAGVMSNVASHRYQKLPETGENVTTFLKKTLAFRRY